MQTLDSLLCRALPGCPKFTDSGLCDFCSGGMSMVSPADGGGFWENGGYCYKKHGL